MMLQMLAVFAEFEHATIVDRVSAGIERRAKEGRWYAGRPPFGYLFSEELRTLVPDPVKAPVVRRIFDLYTRKRLGTIAIANQLREDQAPAPAAGWGHPAVHWIIGDPTFAGRIRWRDRLFDGVHEPLVDELTFQRAQAILRERGEDISRRRGNASNFLLSGIVRCGRSARPTSACPSAETAAATSTTPAAAARSAGPRHAATNACHATSWNTPSSTSLPASTATATLSQRHSRRPRPEIEQRLASIGAEIARAEQALERYYEAFERGKLSPERCEERLSRLQTRLEDLRSQQAELAPWTPDEAGQAPTPADLAAVADQLEHLLAEGEPQKTKALLRLLIQELRVDGRAQIQPTYRLVKPEVCATSEKVEAAGIEPASAVAPGRASTGIACAFASPAGRLAGGLPTG